MSRFVSLRGVISFIAALSVAVVAAITLSITLTSSLSALRDVGSGQAAALLRAAELSSESLFAVPQDALEVLQNTSRQRAWDWPANSQAVRDEWMSLHRTLMMEAKSRLFALLTYFRDETAMFLSALYDPSAPFVGDAPYIGTRVLFGTPVNATEPRSTVNQTGMPPEGRMYHTSNWSSVPIGDPAFAALLPPREFSPFTSTVVWTGNMILTSGGRYAANAGIFATATHGVGDNMISFIAPLHRAGEVPGEDPPYGLAYSALNFNDLSGFLRDTRATPGTLSVALESTGFIVASSAADTNPVRTSTVVPLGTSAQPGCKSVENTNTIKFDTTNFLICRAHASSYGHAGLSTTVADAGFAYGAGRQLRILSTDDGVYFAGTTQIPIRFRGTSIHLIVLMPEVDVIGDVVRSRNAAIGITCGVFVIVAVIVFVAITLLLAPLGTIAERMQRAADFDDDGADDTVSAMAEVAALQLAYYEMNDELNRIRSFVPQSVLVAKKRRSDDNEDDEGELDTGGASETGSNRSRHSISHLSQSRVSGSRSSKYQAAAASSAAPAASVMSRHVVILIANVQGFSTSERFTPGTLPAALTSVIAEVEAALADSGGVLGGFHGDHFTATFNAVRPCAGASRRACAVALKLAEARPGQDGGSIFRGGTLRFKAGVAAGKCLVGNVGTAAAKTFSVVGPAFPQAVMLERLTRLYGPGCSVLMSSHVYSDVATQYRYRIVDHVLLPPRQPALIAALLGPIASDSAESNQSNNNNGEWLYVVGDHARGDVNAAHNQAFELLASRDRPGCEAAYTAAMAVRPEAANDDSGIKQQQRGGDGDSNGGPADPSSLLYRGDPSGVWDALDTLAARLRTGDASDDAATPQHVDSTSLNHSSRRRPVGPISHLSNLRDAFLHPE